ncbi:MAG TPA: ABC transporter substrate-binding protein [Streptosporangiaceae bacterium]|nr:ABC transporter substrate-binding protein [Streptosporangiaceae bacterium]
MSVRTTASRLGTAHRRVAAFVACSLGLMLIASCQPGRAPSHGGGVDRGTVVVASFNFTESELLAAIFGLAIQHAGIPVQLRLDLGPRELVQPALEQGLVDVVPEYLGTALTSLVPDPGVPMSDPAAVRAALAGALAPWHVQVTTPARAQDQNGVVVTAATAHRLGLRTVSDLRRVASGLTLGGAPECPERLYCLPGLREAYGLRFARFVPFDTETQRVIALRDGVVNVAVLDTTDGNLATGDLALLTDDRHLQPVESVVPVITDHAMTQYGKRLAGAVNAVSAQLTSNALLFMDWRIEVAGAGVLAEARAWLERHGILPRPG